MKKLSALIFLPLWLCACSLLSTGLTDKDVEQYVQAYRNIADISPALKLRKADAKAFTVLTCGPCRIELEKAIQKAGYKDLTAFLVTDARMHLTLRAYASVEIAKLGGKVSGKVSVDVESYCRSEDDIAHSKDPGGTKRECQHVLAMTTYLGKAGKVVVELAEGLLHEGDIDIIGKHVDAMMAAFQDEKLVDDFRHGRGGADVD